MRIAVSSRYDMDWDGWLSAAARAGANLLVAGEYALDGSGGFESDAPAFDRIGASVAAHGVPLLLGYREDCTTGVYSSAQLIDGQGHSIANSRSAHPCESRSFSVTPEAEGVDDGNWLTVCQGVDGRLSALLGNDILFPEIARAVMLKGAGLLIALRRRPFEDRELLRAILRTRAYENALAVIGLFGDRVHAFAGDGSSLAPRPGENGLYLVDLPAISLAKPTRRPELYRQLAVVDRQDG
ncbi:MAG: carbon-nitrogen hydrolase family protein [Geminicoccaceae bacterium]